MMADAKLIIRFCIQAGGGWILQGKSSTIYVIDDALVLVYDVFCLVSSL